MIALFDWTEPLLTHLIDNQSTVDAIAGKDKHDLCNEFINGMDSQQRDEFFERLSEAEKCMKFLNRDDRMAGDIKHGQGKRSEKTRNARKETEAIVGQKFVTREYEVTDYAVDGIPADNCSWTIKDNNRNWAQSWIDVNDHSQGRWTTKNGLQEMFHFRFHPAMPMGVVAVRRIPCLCHGKGGCYEQLTQT